MLPARVSPTKITALLNPRRLPRLCMKQKSLKEHSGHAQIEMDRSERAASHHAALLLDQKGSRMVLVLQLGEVICRGPEVNYTS